MIITQKRYFRSDLKNNLGRVYYVFGDNLKRVGNGGQAYEVRGEPNAIGIPTKHLPRDSAEAFFKESDFDTVAPEIDKAFELIRSKLELGYIVVWPQDGVGTGYARLEQNAPTILEYIDAKYKDLLKRY